jgi:glucose/arabinose dehydrogenase
MYKSQTDNNGNTVIARYQVLADNANQADPASEVVILRITQPFGNHNGGQLQFGPDGYLYVGMGDGGSGGDPRGHGQNPATLLGALLRLDVDQTDSGAGYGIPASNPFVGNDAGRNEIWAIGLRNPWRFSFDRLTDDLYIADVGQSAWEEIDFQAADSNGGENYGWNIMEGNHCFRDSNCDTAGLELPVFEYTRDKGCSVSGGYVYRGQQFPSLSGNYFLGDFCSGIIWSLLRQPDGNWTATQVLASDLNISSFGQDLSGELYVLDHNGGVYQLRP